LTAGTACTAGGGMTTKAGVLLDLQAILRTNDDYMFFQSAYQWKYGKQMDVHGDVIAWRVQETIPAYVSDFVYHVRSSAPMTEQKTVVLATDYWRQQRGDADDDSFGF